MPTYPERVRSPAVPAVPDSPRPGRFVWTCRAGFEAHLYEELAWANLHPRLLGPTLVESDARADAHPAFGRSGFRTLWGGTQPPPWDVCAQKLLADAKGAKLLVQGWAVDHPDALGRSKDAEAGAEALMAQLPESARAASAERAGVLGQWVAAGPSLWMLGAVRRSEAVSLAPGGRQRMRRDPDAPSRASMKLEEALTELGQEPGKGEVCVDLGAAPGGWTQRLVDRGAKVVAVDPANLNPELQRHPRVRHVKDSAFAFEPSERVDWLFCDMAWRPLEVAQLLAKWGRRKWATRLVANIKLPMQDKNPILFRVRATLEDAGWQRLRMRQLYHDRDEVTVTATRRA